MKQKTHSGTKKRVKLTARHKLLTKKAGKNHLLVHKSKASRRSSARSGRQVDPVNVRTLRRQLAI